jgi:RNA polymerase sigma-70 factor, ECF subfamily
MADDDTRLIELARAGNIDAFATFVGRHEHRVRVVLMRLLRDARDVEEATQDVFVQAWRHLDRFRGDAAPSTWLYRIAVNEALMRQRRRQLVETELDEATAAPRSSSTASAAEIAELRSFLLLQISELPFEYRAPLVLRDVSGLSNEEVAAVLGITVAAAKSRVHRARMRVRAALEQWEGGA